MASTVKVSSEAVFAVIAAFLLFWLQSGWYRVDCALQIADACKLIEVEYEADAERARRKAASE